MMHFMKIISFLTLLSIFLVSVNVQFIILNPYITTGIASVLFAITLFFVFISAFNMALILL